jgi:hypothetical protein
MNPKLRRGLLLWLVVGSFCLVVLLAGAGFLAEGRTLTPTEQQVVGSWEFTEAERPTTRVVYHFEPDGRAVEEHYYLTSATPLIPALAMHGAWRVESDGQLVVERVGGANGLAMEATRRVRSLAGQQRYQFPLLRRLYKLTTATPERLIFTELEMQRVEQ